jgi:hypothetical protein
MEPSPPRARPHLVVTTPPEISRAAAPYDQRRAPADRSVPRRHHRARGRRGPAAAGAARASPGDALWRRRGGEGVGEAKKGALPGCSRSLAGATREQARVSLFETLLIFESCSNNSNSRVKMVES